MSALKAYVSRCLVLRKSFCTPCANWSIRKLADKTSPLQDVQCPHNINNRCNKGCACKKHLHASLYDSMVENSRAMCTFAGKNNDLLFRQLTDKCGMSVIDGEKIEVDDANRLLKLLEYQSFTYTYLLADPDTKEAILIDPVIDTVERDVKIVTDFGLKLRYGYHITGTGKIKKEIPTCESVLAAAGNAKADVQLKDGDIIKFGKYAIEARSTPGHTNGCMTFVLHKKGMAFTGDALLIRGCGRTDFQQGNAGLLYDSVHEKILSLPDDFMLFPGHDYTGQTMTTVAEEKRFNARLTKSKLEFVKIMKNLNLPYPKQIDKAVPANLVCGIQP